MLSSIQTTVHSLASPSLPEKPYRNFLFIAPRLADAGAAQIADEKIIALARLLAEEGYVYVARAGQADIEDDQFGVRYLPLSRERLPSFGFLTAAFVVGDKTLATAAAVEYATADVFLLEPSSNGMRKRRVPQLL